MAGDTKARLFTQHPGKAPEHNYWTGDLGCGYGHFFQNKTALIALYDIPPKQRHQFIHAYLPRSAFDNVVEVGGSIFASYDCPHLQSAWDSGVFVLGDGTNQLRLDFTRP